MQQQQLHGPRQSLGCREQPFPSAALLVLSGCHVCTHTEDKSQPCMVPFVPCWGHFLKLGAKVGLKQSFLFPPPSHKDKPVPPKLNMHQEPGALPPCSQIRWPSLKPSLEPNLQVTCASHQQSRPLPSPSTLLCLPETTDRVNCAGEASKSIPYPELFPRTAKSHLQRPRAALVVGAAPQWAHHWLPLPSTTKFKHHSGWNKSKEGV